jgi:hypothetical protein
MKARTAARLAWSLWAAYAAATVTFLLLASLNGESGVVAASPILFAFTAFATIGALLMSRYPQHPVGWIFMTIGLGTALGNLTQQYAIYTLFTDADSALPGGVAAAWLGGWLWTAAMGVIVFLPLLLPSGRLPSARWRPVAWGAGVAMSAIVAAFLFKPGPVDIGKQYPVDNPLGIAGWARVLNTLRSVGAIAYVVIIATATIGLIVRAHGAPREERQQLKWFGYAGAFMLIAAFALGPLAEHLLQGDLGGDIGTFFFGLGVAALPVGTGIAILRYHLYDIDLIINRTLVYGALTAVLALVYVGGVVGVGGLVRDATGQGRNELVVAASTLAVAGLFRPARDRIQGFIDRRFYRSRYDAQRTVEAFSVRLRDDIELDAMTRDLLAVVRTTVQPRHASIWLRIPQQQR